MVSFYVYRISSGGLNIRTIDYPRTSVWEKAPYPVLALKLGNLIPMCFSGDFCIVVAALEVTIELIFK